MKSSDVAAVFLAKDNFLLLIHHSPDGDAIASSLGLRLGLKALGKTVDVVCCDPVPVQFSFLPSAHRIKQDFLIGDYDVIVTLDCGDSNRTGFSDRLKFLAKQKQKIIINIDHHAKNDLHDLVTHNLVDYTAPSTSYMVHDVLRRMNVAIDHKIATCLLTGLYTDTGGFKHPNTTPDALKFAAAMLSCGARLKDITFHISPLTSVSRLKLWGTALSRIYSHPELSVVSTYILQKDIADAGATEEDIAGIATLLLTLSSDVAVLVVEKPDKSYQLRMRTANKSVDLARLATYLGGGGQKKAAGFTLKARGSIFALGR